MMSSQEMIDTFVGPDEADGNTRDDPDENAGLHPVKDAADVRRVQGVLVIAPALSKLDLSTATEFRLQVLRATRPEKRLILDMQGIHFVDSSGLGAILAVLRELTGDGGDLRLCGLQKRVRVMFELVRMHRVLTLHETVEDAARALIAAVPAV